MSSSHKSSKLSLSKQLIPIDENTTFLAHYDITANDVLRGAEPSIDSVYTMIPLDGYYGGGIAIEEGTSNIILNPDFSTTNTWALSTNSTGNASFITDGEWGKINVPSGDSGKYYYIYQNVARVTPANTPITFSTKFKNNTSGRFALRLVMFTSGNAVQQPMVEVDLDGSLLEKTYSVTATHIEVTDKLRFDILAGSYYSSFGGLSDKSVEFTNALGEQKPFSTSFVETSREIGKLDYGDISQFLATDEHTLSMWVKNNDLGKSQGWNMAFSVSPAFYLGWNGNSRYRVSVCDSNRSQTVLDYISLFNTGDWHMISYTFDNGTLKLFLDGKKVGEKTITSTISYNRNDNETKGLFVGNYHNSGIYQFNGIIDELRIDKIARSEEEIESWYISQLPFYPKGIYRLAY